MKAKVIATGEIVDVSYSHTTDDGTGIYKDNQERCWSSYELECKETYIDWEQRRFDLAKFALQGLLSNVKYQELSDGYNELAKTKGKTFDETVFYAELACGFADAVITKLKKK